ncbi:MAG: D-alanyl-D-alanine carboxypeptidase family protein [Ruminococcus sp.]|nr:D-alanyl-D-alanine carboxypeptidase family protein [Ruminococcus sp.]
MGTGYNGASGYNSGYNYGYSGRSSGSSTHGSYAYTGAAAPGRQGAGAAGRTGSRSRHRRGDKSIVNAMLWALYIFAVGGAIVSSVFKKSTAEIIDNHGHFASMPSYNTEVAVPQNTIPYDPSRREETITSGVLDIGYRRLGMAAGAVKSGLLVDVGKGTPPGDIAAGDTVRLKAVMNSCYALKNEDIVLNSEAAEALNEMMEDYYSYSGVADLVVYGTTDTYAGEGSPCPMYFTEDLTGCTVDIAVITDNGMLSYNGLDSQGWISQHCAEYGFVVRFPEGKKKYTGYDYVPWHLRYVGRLNAAAMSENNYCLEELLSFVKGYYFEAPYVFYLNGTERRMYYVSAADADTDIKVPNDGGYEVSGNYKDGFIVTIWD